MWTKNLALILLREENLMDPELDEGPDVDPEPVVDLKLDDELDVDLAARVEDGGSCTEIHGGRNLTS